MMVGLNLNNSYGFSFGNQTQRGKLLKTANFIEKTLVDEFLPNKFRDKLSRNQVEVEKVVKTRWNVDNRRYQGKDKRKLDK
jgi:hypothetical protein